MLILNFISFLSIHEQLFAIQSMVVSCVVFLYAYLFFNFRILILRYSILFIYFKVLPIFPKLVALPSQDFKNALDRILQVGVVVLSNP